MARRGQAPTITPELLLRAYAFGLFPMAESAESAELYWFDPPMRGILPLSTDGGLHIPRRLRRTIRGRPFELRIDSDFAGVIHGCAEPRADRRKTWINSSIVELYSELFAQGHAHTVECWAEGRLVGGLYGVSLNAAFFGESMFSRAEDASKVALVHLVALLRHGGYSLLDTQFTTPHLQRFGGREIPQDEYKMALQRAMRHSASWQPGALDHAVAALLDAT